MGASLLGVSLYCAAAAANAQVSSNASTYEFDIFNPYFAGRHSSHLYGPHNFSDYQPSSTQADVSIGLYNTASDCDFEYSSSESRKLDATKLTGDNCEKFPVIDIYPAPGHFWFPTYGYGKVEVDVKGDLNLFGGHSNAAKLSISDEIVFWGQTSGGYQSDNSYGYNIADRDGNDVDGRHVFGDAVAIDGYLAIGTQITDHDFEISSASDGAGDAFAYAVDMPTVDAPVYGTSFRSHENMPATYAIATVWQPDYANPFAFSPQSHEYLSFGFSNSQLSASSASDTTIRLSANDVTINENSGPIQMSINTDTKVDDVTLTLGGSMHIGPRDGQLHAFDYSEAIADYLLWVERGIVTEDIVLVGITEWADKVFEPDYKLQSLAEVEAFVKKNKHLPGVPSEADVQSLKGVNLPDLFVAFLTKIEELFLYTMSQQDQLDTQAAQIAELQKQVKALKKR